MESSAKIYVFDYEKYVDVVASRRRGVGGDVKNLFNKTPFVFSGLPGPGDLLRERSGRAIWINFDPTAWYIHSHSSPKPAAIPEVPL